MAKQREDTITWLQIHNLVPFLGTIVAVVSSFYILSNKVDLQTQRQDYIQEQVKATSERAAALEARLHQQELTIGRSSSQREVQGASTASSIDLKSGGLELLPTTTPKK